MYKNENGKRKIPMKRNVIEKNKVEQWNMFVREKWRKNMYLRERYNIIYH